MEKDQFIETILNSSKGISHVAPSNDLFSKIEHGITAANVPARTIWWVAASVAVLVALNITAVSAGKKPAEDQTTTVLASTLAPNNQLY